MKILVVDDYALNTLRWKHLLERGGNTVLVAQSGEKAKQLIAEDPGIRLVITDLLMPEMDGIQLFKSVLKLDRHDDSGCAQRPRFVLVSAVRPESAVPSERRLLADARALGIDAILQKPGSPAEIQEQVDLAAAGSNFGAAPANTRVGAPQRASEQQLLNDVRSLMKELRSSSNARALQAFQKELRSLLEEA